MSNNENITKARFFEERARKTQDPVRRERYSRAAQRYKHLATKEADATTGRRPETTAENHPKQ